MSARHLVTGAAGVIGFELTQQLLQSGDYVLAVDDGRKGGFEDLEVLARAHASQLDVRKLDIARERPLAGDAALTRGGGFDSFFHLAAIVGVRYVTDHPWETIDVNLRSTLNVLALAREVRPKTVLFASSSENYASTVEHGFARVPTGEDVLLSIDDIALPRWSYAASKIAGESAVFAAARDGAFTPVVVRFHNIYGPRMGPTHVIPEFLARCKRRDDPFPIFGSDQTRSFLYVEDAGRALRIVLDAGRRGAGGTYNIGAEIETKIADLARVVFDVTGHRPRIDERPAPPGSVSRRVPDVTKLTALGFRPTVALADGVRACWQSSRA